MAPIGLTMKSNGSSKDHVDVHCTLYIQIEANARDHVILRNLFNDLCSPLLLIVMRIFVYLIRNENKHVPPVSFQVFVRWQQNRNVKQ